MQDMASHMLKRKIDLALSERACNPLVARFEDRRIEHQIRSSGRQLMPKGGIAPATRTALLDSATAPCAGLHAILMSSSCLTVPNATLF
jgi:hypothetical protein